MNEQLEATDDQVMRLQQWLEEEGWHASIEWKKCYFRKAKPKWEASVVVRKFDNTYIYGLARLEDLSAPPNIEDLRRLAGKAIIKWNAEPAMARSLGENE